MRSRGKNRRKGNMRIKEMTRKRKRAIMINGKHLRDLLFPVTRKGTCACSEYHVLKSSKHAGRNKFDTAESEPCF